MKSLLRWLVGIFIMLGTLLLSNCSPYGCRVTFGSSTCTSSGSSSLGGGGGSGGGGGGGGGATPTAFVYAVDDSGTIDGYVLSDSASTFGAISNFTAPTIYANSGGVGMALAQGQYVYAGLGDSGGWLYGWTISASGSLSPISGTPVAAPFLATLASPPGRSQMITNPTGTLLFISDTLQSQIYVFQIGSGGVLTPVNNSSGIPGFSLPLGFEPMNLATDGLGKYLYAINGNSSSHQGSAIAAFSIGTGSNLGVLTPVNGSPFSGAGYNMWQVQGEPTGQFLVGTTGSTAYYGVPDDTNLYVFTISQSGSNPGAITLLAKTATTYSPFNIAVQSNTGGTLIYSLGVNDTGTAFNPIEGFSISSTGTLTADANSPFSNVGEGSWGQFDQSGALLFVYASFLNSSTNETTTQLSPLSVGSGGALTQPVATGTQANPGLWVVTDPL
jgi:hypothetical protein